MRRLLSRWTDRSASLDRHICRWKKSCWEERFSKNKSIFEREVFVTRSAWNRLSWLERIEAANEWASECKLCQHMTRPCKEILLRKMIRIWVPGRESLLALSNLLYISPFFQSFAEHTEQRVKKYNFFSWLLYVVINRPILCSVLSGLRTEFYSHTLCWISRPSSCIIGLIDFFR